MMEEEVYRVLNSGDKGSWRNWEYENYVNEVLNEKSREESSNAFYDECNSSLEAIDNESGLTELEKIRRKSDIRQKELKRRMEELRETQRKSRQLFG